MRGILSDIFSAITGGEMVSVEYTVDGQEAGTVIGVPKNASNDEICDKVDKHVSRSHPGSEVRIERINNPKTY
jgi:hypothetical protein